MVEHIGDEVIKVPGKCICGLVEFEIGLDSQMIEDIPKNCYCCAGREPPIIAWAVVPWAQCRITAGAGLVNLPAHPDAGIGDRCKTCTTAYDGFCSACGGFIQIQVDDIGPGEWHILQVNLVHRKDAVYAKEGLDLIFMGYASGRVREDNPIDKIYDPQFFVE